MTIWAVLCLVLFLITFAHHQGTHSTASAAKIGSPKQDFADLLKNGPWKVMFAMTSDPFLPFSRSGAARYTIITIITPTRRAMFDWLQKLGLTAPASAQVHLHPAASWNGWATSSTATGPTWPNSNVADVFNSIINMIGTASRSSSFCFRRSLPKNSARRLLRSAASRWPPSAPWRSICSHPTNISGMIAITILVAICLCADHPVDLGHVCGRGGLFGMEDRPPVHGHRFRHHWFCAEIRPGPRLFLFPLDHGRLFQLRHQAARRARSRAGLPRSAAALWSAFSSPSAPSC